MKKRWRILNPDSTLPSELFPDLHPVAVRLLANRKITEAQAAEDFLNPDWETGIHDPFSFSRMGEAVARTFTALEKGERITVHGDYDADGVTGSAVVITTLREIEKQLGTQHFPPPAEPRLRLQMEKCGGAELGTLIDYYIPHRDKEGYGLHPETVEIFKQRGTNLIITVDCGIACSREIALAKNYGIETVVLDHHQLGDELPAACLVHPKIPGEIYPFEHLAAVGVAWKFACALLAEARQRGLRIGAGYEKWLLDLVSIATVTDMVPLVGENRVLMKYGLKVLNKTRRIGLRSLIEIAGRKLGSLDTESIGFSLGPRINAAGRMDHATLALRLILSETPEESATLVVALERCNRERQRRVEIMMEEADRQIAGQAEDRAHVLWSPQWQPALVGLVAGKMLERTGRPCVCVGKHEGIWIGSGRSISSYDISDAMRRLGDGLLKRVGGHAQACGFSFDADEYAPLLADRIRADAATRLSAADLVPELVIDAELDLTEIDWRLVDTLARFEPYGIANPRPLFVTRGLDVVEIGLVGRQGNHLRCTLRSPSGMAQRFIGFKLGPRLNDLTLGKRVDVVYDVGVNEWNGRRDIQCKMVDFL